LGLSGFGHSRIWHFHFFIFNTTGSESCQNRVDPISTPNPII
jgi:hypothetical protein